MENSYKKFLSDQMLENIKKKHEVLRFISFKEIEDIANVLYKHGLNYRYKTHASKEEMLMLKAVKRNIATECCQRPYLAFQECGLLTPSHKPFHFILFYCTTENHSLKINLCVDYGNSSLDAWSPIIVSMMTRLLKKMEKIDCFPMMYE